MSWKAWESMKPWELKPPLKLCGIHFGRPGSGFVNKEHCWSARPALWDKKQGCQRTDRRQRCHGTGQAGTTVGDGSGDFALVKRQRLSEWLVFLNNWVTEWWEERKVFKMTVTSSVVPGARQHLWQVAGGLSVKTEEDHGTLRCWDPQQQTVKYGSVRDTGIFGGLVWQPGEGYCWRMKDDNKNIRRLCKETWEAPKRSLKRFLWHGNPGVVCFFWSWS